MDEKEFKNIWRYLEKKELIEEIKDKKLKEKWKKNIEKYELRENKLYKKKNEEKRRVIPRYELEAVLYLVHDEPLAGHVGIERCYDKMKERYYWKGMLNDIKEYVRSCDKCQRRGKPQEKNELHCIKVKEPFYQIGLDFVGPLPATEKGNKYIIVAVDYFTKYPEAKAVKEATAKEVSTFIYEEIICRHGCVEKILTDRGSHFNNKMIQELMEKFKIKHNFSTPYHPKTNGLVERFNKTLCEGLAKLGNERRNWDEFIAPTLFAYRTSKQSTTKIEPFYLTYGRKARLILDDEEEIKEIKLNKRIEDLLEKLPTERSKSKERIERKQQKQKEYHDKKIKIKEKFNVGDKVLYYNAAKEKQWSGKLEEKFKGYFIIKEILLNGSYRRMMGK